MTVTFFGHRNTPYRAKRVLKATIINLIENCGADRFYVGNHGDFDAMVRSVLKEMARKYKISYAVVLAYSPFLYQNKLEDYSDTIFPQELENATPKSAISKRNEWLIKHSDLVVTWVTNSYGGAYKYKRVAEKKGKRVINIAQSEAFCVL